MGDDDFICGKLYLMIDSILCNQCLFNEFNDLYIVVVLFDLVFGYGVFIMFVSELLD